MIHSLRCPAISPQRGPLVFDWDDQVGTVTGPGAGYIEDWLRCGVVPLHPHPASHLLAAGPLTSRADLAAIVGIDYRLPEELLADYPVLADADDPGEDEIDDIFPDAQPFAADQFLPAPTGLLVY